MPMEPKKMQKSILAVFFAVISMFTAPMSMADEFSEPAILTVTGNVAKPNRGPIDPFDDVVFNFMGIEFENGFTFSHSELKSLPQRTLRLRYPDWPGELEVVGPSIVDVLKAAGAEGGTVLVQAIDGYAFEFTGEDIARDKMVLAMSVDGRGLSLGGRGPLWLVGPTDSFTGQEAEEGFVFAVIRIDVQ